MYLNPSLFYTYVYTTDEIKILSLISNGFLFRKMEFKKDRNQSIGKVSWTHNLSYRDT